MRLFLRLRLALWAARNPDVLTMLHFEMLRDGQGAGFGRPAGIRPARYAARLTDARMPGAAENIAAL